MSNPFIVSPRAQRMRLAVFAVLSLFTASLGVYLMYQILSANDLKLLEAVILVFFAISFGWISMAFWSAFFGFVFSAFLVVCHPGLGAACRPPRFQVCRKARS